MVSDIESLFPGLRDAHYQVTSPRERRYNCIGWAAGDDRRWWWPDPPPDDEAYYWPEGAGNEETLSALMAAFATIGYSPCDSKALEPDHERIALFASPTGVPTHAARQLANGRWTSKLGRFEDIEHGLGDIEGEQYGAVVLIMKRPRT